MRAVAIGLKIPDNTAYTALTALRRLGVDVARIERDQIWLFESDDARALAERIRSDERLFNPNTQRLKILESTDAEAGELRIETLDAAEAIARGAVPAAIAWHLYDADDKPVAPAVLAAAAERLLCNPAIERAIYPRKILSEKVVSNRI